MRRKRLSHYLLTSAALACFTVASCGEPPKVEQPTKKAVAATDTIYSNYQQCLVEHSDAECKDAMEKAKVEQEKSAPKFGSKAECEAQFGVGRCETSSGGSFMPMMMGFMLGNMLANAGGGGYYDGRDRDRYGPRSSPVYYGSNGAIYSRGSQLGTLPKSSLSTVGTRTMEPMVVTRGGLDGRGTTAVMSRSTYAATYTAPRTTTATAPARAGSTHTGSVARGGFGATASARGSGG